MQRGGGGQREMMQALQAANDPDKFFVVEAAIDNAFEVQLSQIAQQKAQDPQVKQIAQRMIQDHQQANQQLQQTAQGLGLTVPQTLPMIKQHELQIYQQLSGQDFDKQYLSCLKAGHAKDVSKFQDVSQTAKNDQVKQFAQQQLPILQQHAQQVQQAAVAVGLPSGNEAMTAGSRMSGSSSSGASGSSGTSGSSSGSSGLGGSSSGSSGSTGSSGSSGSTGSSGSSGSGSSGSGSTGGSSGSSGGPR